MADHAATILLARSIAVYTIFPNNCLSFSPCLVTVICASRWRRIHETHAKLFIRASNVASCALFVLPRTRRNDAFVVYSLRSCFRFFPTIPICSHVISIASTIHDLQEIYWVLCLRLDCPKFNFEVVSVKVSHIVLFVEWKID